VQLLDQRGSSPQADVHSAYFLSLCAAEVTPKDPDVFHPAATCRTRIGETTDLGLADGFGTVSTLTRKPVKVTMLAKVVTPSTTTTPAG